MAYQHRNENDHGGIDYRGPQHRIVTRNPAMLALTQRIKCISPFARILLVAGETGAGKELVVRLFNEYCMKNGSRTGGLVLCDAGGTDDHLFSDTLFGHKKGAFTGADKDRVGLVAKAQNGVLFLDEIGDLSLFSQKKLLRLIQTGEYLPLGSDKLETADVFIVLATHKPLRDMVRRGEFRKDLYYRIRMFHIPIPPLRDRKEDIALLARHFAEKFGKEWGIRTAPLDAETIDLLMNYDLGAALLRRPAMRFEVVHVAPSSTG
jgi:transcriptional regulator with GAF, ATPase, and Fis domain